MKIGEFAKACHVPVSVLRYYDNYGLLKPYYIDRFTGYRYYSESQMVICQRINEMKNADFSLAEIKQVISGSVTPAEIGEMFDKKKSRLNETLQQLDELRDAILGGNLMPETKIKLMHEDVHIPFENDERIVGRWEIVGEYQNRTEYDLGNKLPEDELGGKNREMYFLSGGEWYWCYSWTKGKLLFENGESSFSNDYTVENHPDGLLMFVNYKSYDYLQSGQTTLLVLRQCDNIPRSAKDISRKDDIDMPFADDPAILGKWKAVCFVKNKEKFSPQAIRNDFVPFFKEIEFLPDGECISLYGDKVISGRDMQEWTKGFVLRKWNSTACAYEILRFDAVDYLLIEWKSGDYRWGGLNTDYYVFVRA